MPVRADEEFVCTSYGVGITILVTLLSGKLNQYTEHAVCVVIFLPCAGLTGDTQPPFTSRYWGLGRARWLQHMIAECVSSEEMRWCVFAHSLSSKRTSLSGAFRELLVGCSCSKVVWRQVIIPSSSMCCAMRVWLYCAGIRICPVLRTLCVVLGSTHSVLFYLTQACVICSSFALRWRFASWQHVQPFLIFLLYLEWHCCVLIGCPLSS